MLNQIQLEKRLDYVCGTDAAVICGLSPYKNQIELWQEKTRQILAKDISENPYVKAGNFLEPAVRAWFEHETGLKVKEVQDMIVSKENPFMAANIDGFIEEEGAVFEAKTTSSEKGWGESGSNEVPDHYLLQVVHYMAVTGAKKAYIAVLIRGVDFRYYEIERNENLEKIIVEKERKFWECVKNEEPPSPETSKEYLSLNGFRSIEDSAVADGEIQKHIERLEEVNLQMSVLSSEKDEISDKIKIFMSEKDTLLGLDGKIVATWKSSKPSKRFDLETFKSESIDLYEKYSKEYPGVRRFLIKKKQEL